MRITDRIVQRGLVDDIHRQLERMSRLQHDISSGTVVHNLSDDPSRAARSVALKASHDALVQHRQSATEGVSWMNATLASLATVRQSVQEARVKAVQGGSDTQSAETREVLGLAVEQLSQQVLETANSQWNGASLFAGTKTSTDAFSSTGVYEGDTGAMTRDIAPGQTSVVNLTGQEVFITGENVFTVLEDLQTALGTNDGAAIRGLLPRLDTALNQILKFEAELGAEVKRVESTMDRLDELEVNIKERLSENDDTDMARALVDLQNANNLYQASLKASSELFKTTLLDFLR